MLQVDVRLDQLLCCIGNWCASTRLDHCTPFRGRGAAFCMLEVARVQRAGSGLCAPSPKLRMNDNVREIERCDLVLEFQVTEIMQESSNSSSIATGKSSALGLFLTVHMF